MARHTASGRSGPKMPAGRDRSGRDRRHDDHEKTAHRNIGKYDMAYLAGFIWGIFPYICFVVMIVGTVYRYQTDQLRWTSKSSELLEKKLLILGSVSFHIGLL